LVAILFFSSALAAPSATAGKELYETNGCANCHGRTGRGDGPAAKSLPAKPTDLRDPSRFKKGSTEAAIARTLETGVEIEHLEPGQQTPHHMLVMPKFNHLTRTERRSIALYVLSLGKADK
jgi:mono/diheme cytochrome c family protein